MYKRLALLVSFVLLLFLAASCGVESNYESIYENNYSTVPTPGPIGVPAPLFHVDGNLYGLHGRWGRASSLMDDSYVYIGTIPSYTHLFQNVTENFQTNDPHLVGARLYQSGENIILVIDGVYSLHRFIGETILIP